ncbi:hypothetical protein L288_04035 [Sphingobium quisquiliarum P25]|uniref:Cyclase dehydrase n=1 Tax=Sphingobium quisquiliarum P25 TaxID=1329909 RepID=T0ILD1_9SPHN|nr:MULTISPECIES: hypothetical protein [Sphingobium]EQB10459.1 hypothetical protein L288_04035 [Sphingobium quisquiliarum P25]
MDPRRISLGLGVFSIALGIAEIAATRRIARALGNDHRTGRATLRAFGAREMLAGAGLVAAPAHSTLMWGRVAGDALDLAALGLAAGRAPRRGAVWGAIAFVTGVAVIDALVARSLDRQTGRAYPWRGDGASSANGHMAQQHPSSIGHATTIEPDDMPFVRAPEVTHH